MQHSAPATRDPTTRDFAAGPQAMNWSRWRLVLLLMAICFVAHFNRLSMPIAADLRIMKQYGLSPTTMGSVYSAFLIAYTVFMIPGGWLIDRRGPKFALQTVCFGSAAFVALTGCVGLLAPSSGSGAAAVAAFVMVRALMGMLSAPLHPAAAKAVSLDVPVAGRSMANGMVTGAALLGVAATPVLFGGLIDFERLDWPGAFVVAGLATATLGLLWTFYATDHAHHADRSASRVEAPPARVTHVHRPAAAPIGSFVRRNKNLLLLTFSYAAVGYFQYLFFYWTHYYFDQVLKLGEAESRLYATIPPLSMAVGMPLGGWLSDRLESRFSWRVARAGLAGAAMASSAGLLLLGVVARDPFWIVTWLSLALGVLGLAEGPFWVTAVQVGGRRGGLSASIFNTGGNFGGLLAPVVTPLVSDELGFGWQAGIGLGSLVCLVGAAMWYWIDLSADISSDELSAVSSIEPL